MQTVGQFLDDMARFSRDARMEPECNPQSHAPSVLCRLDGFDPDRVSKLEDEMEGLQKELEDAEQDAVDQDALRLIRQQLEGIKESATKEEMYAAIRNAVGELRML